MSKMYLLQCSTNFYDKKTSDGAATSANKNISTKKLAGKLHKPVIGTFNRKKTHLL